LVRAVEARDQPEVVGRATGRAGNASGAGARSSSSSWQVGGTDWSAGSEPSNAANGPGSRADAQFHALALHMPTRPQVVGSALPGVPLSHGKLHGIVHELHTRLHWPAACDSEMKANMSPMKMTMEIANLIIYSSW
jgi:hypothetical protein